jgi:hypothetical protein
MPKLHKLFVIIAIGVFGAVAGAAGQAEPPPKVTHYKPACPKVTNGAPIMRCHALIVTDGKKPLKTAPASRKRLNGKQRSH